MLGVGSLGSCKNGDSIFPLQLIGEEVVVIIYYTTMIQKPQNKTTKHKGFLKGLVCSIGCHGNITQLELQLSLRHR